MSGVNVSGTWRDIAQPYVNVSGTWRTVSEIHANVSGTWKKVWPLEGVVMTDQSSPGFSFGGTATGGAYFGSNGQYQRNLNFSYTSITGEWYSAPAVGVGSGYDIRATLVSSSGSATRTGPTLGTWHSLSSNRHWYISTTTNGQKTWVLDIDVRDSSTLSIVGSARYTLSAEVSSF